MRATTILASLTFAALLLPPASRAEEPSPWSFEVAPYLWAASVSAESSLPPVGSGKSPGAQDFDTKFAGGLLFSAQARYRSVGLQADFNWLRLNTEASNSGPLYSGVDLRSDYIYSTAALTYALPLRGKFHAELLAGARIWNISTDFNLNSGVLPGFESSHSETWVSPIVGADLRYDLTRHWLLLVRGTAGGFTSDSLQWDVFGGVGYQFNDWCMATLGYRYLHEDYSQNNFTFNAQAQGALLGVVFRF